MDGTSQLVAVGGLGLVAVNFWTSKQRPLITGVIWGDSGADPVAAHRALLGMGGELLLVFILVMVANQSDSLAYGMAAIVAALWVLWGINRHGAGNSAPVRIGTSGTPVAAHTTLD